MKLFIRCLSNLLIVTYLAVIYFSGVPESNTLNSRLKQKATSIAFAVGIWPSWSMFAPNPIKFDSKTYIDVTYKDGNSKIFDVEIPLEGPLATFRKARWMKYSQDNLRSPRQKGLLLPAVWYHKRKYENLDNPIISISIKRIWTDVPSFTDAGTLVPLISSIPRKESSEVLFTHNFEN